MAGIPGAVYKECDSQTEAFAELGRATMAGQKRFLAADGSEEAQSQSQSQSSARVRREPQTANTSNNTNVGTRGDNSRGETVIQCPPTSSSRVRSTIQRANTLPPQQPQSSSNNLVQRSTTVPNLGSSPAQPSPERSARRQEPSASNVGRQGVTSARTDGPAAGDERALSSPVTNVSTTPGPAVRPHLTLSPPRGTPPSRPFPAHQGDQGHDDQASPPRRGSGAREEHRNYRTPDARSVRGSKRSAHTTTVSPPETATNASATSVRSTTRRGTTHQRQPSEGVVRSSPPSTNRPPSIQRGTSNSTSHISRGHSGRPRPSSASSQLTYVSDDERPAGGLAQSDGDPGYYTPRSRSSETSDADPEPPRGAPSSPSLNQKGKRRASPPPPSPLPDQGPSVQGPSLLPPSLSTTSSRQIPNSLPGPSRMGQEGGNSHHSSSQNVVDHEQACDQTPAHNSSQTSSQDVCQCAGPCPSCHKQRHPPYPPPFHPSMFNIHPAYYKHFFPPPPHTQAGYQPSHYGPPPCSYPHAISQTIDLLPSISSTQPIPPPPGHPMPTTFSTDHPTTHHPHSAPVYASSTPVPTSSAPVLSSSVSAPVPPRPLVNHTLVDRPVTGRVRPELSEALSQFSQPLQRPVEIIDPSYDPRSPYSRRAIIPASSNR